MFHLSRIRTNARDASVDITSCKNNDCKLSVQIDDVHLFYLDPFDDWVVLIDAQQINPKKSFFQLFDDSY